MGGPSPAAPLTYAHTNRRRFLEDLCRLVAIPTVSTRPDLAAEVRHGAAWLASRLRSAGMDTVEVVPTPRHPAVLASWRRAPGRPTVLVYGHYDVQPAGTRGWTTPPFSPAIRGNHLFGRGASDDKGQLMIHVCALESYLRGAGRLPVNVVCLFEGEEEIGSPNLHGLLLDRCARLGVDVALMSDTSMPSPERPAITYGLRGALNCELEVTGPPRDLHSGTFGGAVRNPLQTLTEILASLHDREGRIAVPGFHDRVRRVSEPERERLAASGPSREVLRREAGVGHLWGDPTFTPFERTVILPALVISGLSGGWGGPGIKGVIPARAGAKLGLRLVPDQDPAEILGLLRAHLGRVTPPGARATLRVLSGAPPMLVDRHHPGIRAAAAACRATFGVGPVLLRSGGTIPVVGMLERDLRVPTVLLGFALRDDRMHAPDERFFIPNFTRGIDTVIHLLRLIGGDAPRARTPGRRRCDPATVAAAALTRR